MHTYTYRLLLANGRTRSGMLRLVVERDLSAKLWLERHFDAVVLQLYRLPGWCSTVIDAASGATRRALPPVELSGLLRDLAVMTHAGVPIIDALKSIANESDYTQKSAAATARLLAADLDTGASISQTFDRHPDLFPESVRNLMVIGEETGNVDRMLLEAAEHIERLTSLGRDVRQAMIYPAFVFAVIFAAALFWVYYVIPNLAELFTQMRVKLPAVTRVILTASKWLEVHAAVSLALLGLTLVGIWLLLRLHTGTRRVAYRLAHRLPIARVIVTSSGMAFIAEHLAMLVNAGIDIIRSLGVLERALSDEYYRDRIRAVRASVARGGMLAPAMRNVGGFPPMVLRMIAVGEETGSLDRQLTHLAQEYRARLAHLIGSLSEVIKPLIILAAGAFFILLIVALLLPIYELVRQASMAPTH
jgi:general secretion pathway protein F/type IV pilus assembly protein PilC